MEARFLHESEAPASSWGLPGLPVARNNQIRGGREPVLLRPKRQLSRPAAAGAAPLGENNLLQRSVIKKIACAGASPGWRSK
jgi:hypothetical protein